MFPFPIIENFSLVAPLGLCFHDAATGERVIDGLSVSVYPVENSYRVKKATAFPNRSGVYVVQKLAGLGDFSRGTGDAEFWLENQPQKNYAVEVFDTANRFQPFRLTLRLPVKGIYQWENVPPTSPNQTVSSIPLYSAPSRRGSSGMAIVRAELRENDKTPAAFAVLEARIGSELVARGIADREGRIVLMFPALSPRHNPLASPPNGATRVSLADQEWELDFTLRYQPGGGAASLPQEKSGADAFPDLRLVLAQKPGKLWANVQKKNSFTTAVLRVGRELVLRSRLAETPAPGDERAFSSYLFVSPAA